MLPATDLKLVNLKSHRYMQINNALYIYDVDLVLILVINRPTTVLSTW